MFCVLRIFTMRDGGGRRLLSLFIVTLIAPRLSLILWLLPKKTSRRERFINAPPTADCFVGAQLFRRLRQIEYGMPQSSSQFISLSKRPIMSHNNRTMEHSRLGVLCFRSINGHWLLIPRGLLILNVLYCDCDGMKASLSVRRFASRYFTEFCDKLPRPDAFVSINRSRCIQGHVVVLLPSILSIFPNLWLMADERMEQELPRRQCDRAGEDKFQLWVENKIKAKTKARPNEKHPRFLGGISSGDNSGAADEEPLIIVTVPRAVISWKWESRSRRHDLWLDSEKYEIRCQSRRR